MVKDMYDHKCIDAELRVNCAPHPITEWGIDLTIDEHNVIFHQGYRDISYPKDLIQSLDFHYSKKKLKDNGEERRPEWPPRMCGTCEKTDGFCLTSDPPQYRCSITGETHEGCHLCDVARAEEE